MHYCLLLITERFPTDAVIKKIMRPYDEDVVYPKDEEEYDDLELPKITWDYWQVGGRYNGKFKLKFDPDDHDSEYRWMFYVNEPRAGRLFRSYLLEEMKRAKKQLFFEEDFFMSMGARDGFIYVDGGKVADMINFETEAEKCFCFIGTDGAAHARRWWSHGKWSEDEHYDEELKEVIANSKDCYATFIDIHN